MPSFSANTRAGLSSSTIYNAQPREFTRGYPLGGPNVDDVIETKANSQNPESFGFPFDRPKYHFVIIENDWSTVSSSLTAKKLIRLPLPTPLIDQFEVNYDKDFNYLGQALSLFNKATGSVGGAIGGAIGAATGLTLNTFKTVTLSVPDYRTFNFTWKLAPKNFEEAKMIQRINFALRKAMTPTGSLGTDKLLLRFPQIFTMYFNPNFEHLYKFKPCVLTTMSVDYGGGNPFPVFYKGSENPPESVTISTTWLELEYWMRDDYKGGDYPSGEDPFDAWNHYNYRTSGGGGR